MIVWKCSSAHDLLGLDCIVGCNILLKLLKVRFLLFGFDSLSHGLVKQKGVILTCIWIQTWPEFFDERFTLLPDMP